MTRALIVYLSLGGTTARVARHIARGCEQSGVEAHLRNLGRPDGDSQLSGPRSSRGAGPEPADFDIIGVGAPAHYYRAPLPVRDFVSVLPPLEGRPCFTFMLHGTYPGCTARDLRAGLEERGGRHLGAFSCRGADRFVAYLRKGFLFSAGHPTDTDLAAAVDFGVSMARAASVPTAEPEESAWSDAVDAPGERDVGWIYRLQRALTGPTLAHHVYSRFFKLDRRRCTGCGACVRRCPTGNISLASDRRPTWGRDCLLCLYCEMVCPEEAVASLIGWPPFDAFVRHNVRRAAADPDLDHVPVSHRHGRTQLLGDPSTR